MGFPHLRDGASCTALLQTQLASDLLHVRSRYPQSYGIDACRELLIDAAHTDSRSIQRCWSG